MPDHLGDDMRKTKDDNKEEPEIKGKCRRFLTKMLVIVSLFTRHNTTMKNLFQLWTKVISNS